MIAGRIAGLQSGIRRRGESEGLPLLEHPQLVLVELGPDPDDTLGPNFPCSANLLTALHLFAERRRSPAASVCASVGIRERSRMRNPQEVNAVKSNL